MIEIKEVLRLRSLGAAKKRIAAQLRLGPKTVRRYVEVGEAHGIVAGGGPEQLTDMRLDAVIAELKKPVPHEHGEAWKLCECERSPARRCRGIFTVDASPPTDLSTIWR